MILLTFFAFLAGIVTILSPCILPVLPIVLSGAIGGGKRRPIGIVIGFVMSFTFFTLTLASIVRLTGLSANVLRSVSVVTIFVFGLVLAVPALQRLAVKIFSKLSAVAPQQQRQQQNFGFSGGVLLGLSLGLIWTPCVGPIIASVITLAATSTVTFSAAVITLAYAIGTGIPMMIITYSGRALLNKIPWLLANTEKIQKVFGVIMILAAIGIFFNADRMFQVYILEKFPNYGVGLTKIEDNEKVKKQLEALRPQQPEPESTSAVAPAPAPAPAPVEKNYPQAPKLKAGGNWFNSPPLTLSSLRGKVVLVDFWTYTCINCIRTLPYIEAWHEKYADKGLVIIGVHTPEFEFEKNPENVAKAIKDFGLKYPIMQDNNYETWRAYNNSYWPAKYFIDKDGAIRATHFGEGDYDESELLLQQLLREANSSVAVSSVSNPSYTIETLTPETYLGYGRMRNLASPENVQPDKEAKYTTPQNLLFNMLAYGGYWNVSSERATPAESASLSLAFGAKEVFLVMRSRNGKPGKLKVFLDGAIIKKESSGADVVGGTVTVIDDRLYRLVKLPKSEKHILKLEFLDGNTELYAFTFG